MVTLRPAVHDDLPQINDIYNFYVDHSTYTHQSTPMTLEEREAWFTGRSGFHPVIVTETGGQILGWSALCPFLPQQGYERTACDVVYVRKEWRGNGIGSVLMQEMVRFGKEVGLHTLLAAIDASQEGSIALHAKFGFKECGRFRESAYKHHRWLDMVWMQKVL